MDVFFELVHLPSGNVVGDFGSQDEALQAVRRLTGGELATSVADFALIRGEGDDQSLVATRDGLRSLVETTLTPSGSVR